MPDAVTDAAAVSWFDQGENRANYIICLIHRGEGE